MMKKQLFSTTQVASLGAYVETTTATVTVIPLRPQGIRLGLTPNARLVTSVLCPAKSDFLTIKQPTLAALVVL